MGTAEVEPAVLPSRYRMLIQCLTSDEIRRQLAAGVVGLVADVRVGAEVQAGGALAADGRAGAVAVVEQPAVVGVREKRVALLRALRRALRRALLRARARARHRLVSDVFEVYLQNYKLTWKRFLDSIRPRNRLKCHSLQRLRLGPSCDKAVKLFSYNNNVEWNDVPPARRSEKAPGGTHDRALNLQQPTHHITLRPDARTHTALLAPAPETRARDLGHALIYMKFIRQSGRITRGMSRKECSRLQSRTEAHLTIGLRDDYWQHDEQKPTTNTNKRNVLLIIMVVLELEKNRGPVTES
ncbi:hypothetical protein MSG28_008349 [Choristoneura fumiferana]|uniref:Uncharacterized protein n=1 Tax=Choristoneura fumiferana TaxID=7141 RepID=A0ACC0JB15_CHOFU|nr:hypothetical protein MSG28_008349 [Choristoneura fumiferana]